MNIKIIFTLVFVGGILFTSCDAAEKKSEENLVEQASSIDTSMLIGSWEDQSQSALHFTLFSDGTAQSDNMKTLVYQQWEVKNKQLYLIAESIGNHNSFIDTMVYDIEQLDKNQMVLKHNNQTYSYKKSFE